VRRTARCALASRDRRPKPRLCFGSRRTASPHLRDSTHTTKADRTATPGHHAGRRLLCVGGVLALAGVGRRDALATRRETPVAFAPDLEDAARRSALCTSKDAPGVGLLGEYFALDACRGDALLTRVDAVVDFDPRLEWPQDRAATPPRSAHWNGWVRAPLDGRYRFHFDADGADVQVARQAMLEPGSVIELRAGRYYPIVATLDRVVDSGRRIRLEWTAPHGARYLIPRALLQLPTGGAPRKT